MIGKNGACCSFSLRKQASKRFINEIIGNSPSYSLPQRPLTGTLSS